MKIKPDRRSSASGAFGLGPSAVALIHRLAERDRLARQGRVLNPKTDLKTCAMCSSVWPVRYYNPPSGSQKKTCPHCRHRSAFKEAVRRAAAAGDPTPEWGVWQPGTAGAQKNTPRYNPRTGAVWSYGSSEERATERIRPYVPLTDPATGTPIVGPDGCWKMPSEGDLFAGVTPAKTQEAHAPRRLPERTTVVDVLRALDITATDLRVLADLMEGNR